MIKKRFELVFTTDGSEKEQKLIEEAVALVLGVVTVTNRETAKQKIPLKVKLKEKI